MTYRFTRAPAHAGVLLFVLASTACASLAHADERPREPVDAWPEARWAPQSVRYPVSPAQVQLEAPQVPEHTGTVSGAIEIGPERAAALWLDALEVVRVRRVDRRIGASTAESSDGVASEADQTDPAAPALVLRRVIGTPVDATARTRGEIEESPLLVTPGLWLVAQPPERGDVWVIAATAPMRVVIERPLWRDDARLWEDTRQAVLQWLDAGGAMPDLPPGPGSLELALGLRADHALAQLLLRHRPDAHGFRRAVREWRCASALTRLAIVGTHGQPYHWFEERTAALVEERAGQGDPAAPLVPLPSEPRPYARTVGDELTWSADLEGPGVLEIDLRALFPEPSQPEHGTGLIRIAAGEHVLLEHRYKRRPAYVDTAGQAPDPAFPQRDWLRIPDGSPDGSIVGSRERVRVTLLPGKRAYSVALSGGQSLVRARVVRRRPRLLEVLRGRAHSGDCIAAAGEALAGDTAPEAAVLAQLLAELRGSTVEGAPAGLSPVLALVADISRRRGRAIDRDTMHALVEHALPVLDQADSDIDPVLAWMLRRDLLELAARADSPQALAALTREVDGLPPILAARMAELVALTVHDGPDAAQARAWALAAARRAWQAAPFEPSIRQMYLRTWRHAPPWSRLDQAGIAELPASPAPPRYRFIERAPSSGNQGNQNETPTTAADRHALWPIELGRRQRVMAEPSPADHRRPVLIRAYVATPLEAPGSVRLHVDAQVFTALPLAPVDVLTVAVPPGAHEVMLEGPAGAEAFLSATPEDAAAQRARIRMRRPAWDQGRAARFAVPAGQDGMPVRLTLRVGLANQAHASEPVRVRLRTDTGHTRSIAIQPAPLDTSWIPTDGAAPVSAPVRTVLWLPPDARWLWLEPEQPQHVGQIWASLALRQPEREAPTTTGISDASPGATPQASPGDPPRATIDDVPRTPPATDGVQARAQTPAPGDPEWTAIVNELAEVSRALATTPDDVSLRLRRVQRLLDLGEVGRVALDWAWIEALPRERQSPDQAAMRDELAHRLADWRDSRYLPVQPQPFEKAMALVPAAMALVSDPARLDAWYPAVLAARQGDRTLLDSTARTQETLLARYYRADLLRREGAHAEAAVALRDIYEETGAHAIGIEALLAFEAALARRPAGETTLPGAQVPELASLAYGLALDMRGRFAHPVARRVLFAAARSSRWEPLRGTEGSAGFESLHVNEDLLDPGPDAALERALVAPPWLREEAGVVHPGRGALLALSLQAPARIKAEAWCQRIRPALEDARPGCAVRWRVTGQPERALDVPLARVTPLGSAALARGRHELEVMLAHDDPTVRLVVRFATSRAIAGEAAARGAALSALRPGRMHVADAMHPVMATVLGPTTIRVEARRYTDEPAVVLVAEARPAQESGAAAVQRQMGVDAGPDPSAIGDAQRNVRLSRASTTELVLPAATPYRLVLRPQEGRALVRLWHRRDVPGATVEAPTTPDREAPPLPDREAPLPAIDAPAAVATSAWPAAIEAGPGAMGTTWQPDTPSSWPTLSAGLSFRRDDLADRDLEDEPLENRLQLDLAWRRQLVPDRFWLRVESALRWHPGSNSAYGGTVDLAWRRLPLDLRLDVMGRAFAQYADYGMAWTAQSRVRVGRPFRLQPSLTLVPGLAAHARFYSLDVEPVFVVIDPLVYNEYDRAHRFGMRPEATLYWRPLQDQLGLAGARVVTNEDFYSPDRAELELAWRGLAPWPRLGFPLFELHYRPGYRFADAGRNRDYVRHDVGIRLDWTLWNGRAGRWLLEVRDEAYLSTVWGNRNVFLIGLRYDAVDGRGLRDMLPIEYRFDELIEPPPWAD